MTMDVVTARTVLLLDVSSPCPDMQKGRGAPWGSCYQGAHPIHGA